MESIIENVLLGKLDSVLLMRWLNNESIEEASDDCILLCCNRKEFVSYFLSFLRNQTESILQTNLTVLPTLQLQSTPDSSNTSRKHHRSISDPTREADRQSDSIKSDRRRSHDSPSRDKKRTGRKVKTKLFPDEKKDVSVSSDESRLNSSFDRLALSSTPLKNGIKFSEYPNQPLSSPVTPQSRSFYYERCDTPRLNRHCRSQDKSVSLGDYIANAQTKSSKKKRSSKNASKEESDVKVDLDLSNSEVFPEIGARKSSSLRSDRRRIKPTMIDKSSSKSFSLNSFNSESFQQPSPLAFEENIAFKTNLQPNEASKNFDAERNILKQERHKLMEKFNILSTSNASKLVSPAQINVSQKEINNKEQSYVTVDFSKVVFKESIDILVEIYNTLIQNNLIMSLNTEIYYLISILLSKQSEEDYLSAEAQLNGNNLSNFILKSIHNSTYFAVRSLWNQKVVLEVILDKNSLKTLGENKKVRNFSPDLAKFLLNSYGLKCEAESDDRAKPESRTSNGIVCFNFETDNAENFSSVLSFQNFKKQRDMFYEILRWYNESDSASRSSFRARVKTLLSVGPTPSNHAHLAALFTAHMLAECPLVNSQESKLSKLQRRLTCPRAPESHRLPHFTDKEAFYKEFILNADNECFKVHLRDAFASEIVALDSTPFSTDGSGGTDSQAFLMLSKKLALLGKFMGQLVALPYSTGGELPTPRPRLLENGVALRNYSQPVIDLQGLLTSAYENGRLCITVPWIVHYLSTIDYTALRLRYYQRLLQTLFYIYNRLKMGGNFKKNTVIFLKSNLGWLFDLPHFPRELFYDKIDLDIDVVSESIDFGDVIDESILFELCPFLKDLTTLLATSRVSQEQKDMGTFRHITPVSLGVNPEDRIRSKEKELQARLEEAFLKSQPLSTRRVLELVVERVAAGVVRQLSAECVPAARARARARAAERARGDRATLLQSLEAMYAQETEALRADAMTVGSGHARARLRSALTALLPHAPAPLKALAAARADRAIARWLRDHVTREILCKSVEEEVRGLLAAGEPPPARPAPPPVTSPAVDCTSAANALIALKELTCAVLEGEEPTEDPNLVLSACARCCSPQNLFCRPPTQRAILRLSIDFCLVFASRKPEQLTEAFLNSLHAVWDTCCPERRRSPGASPDERAPSPSAEDREPSKPDPPEPTDDQLEFFDRILCPRNIVLLSDTGSVPTAVWEAVASVLVFLLRHDYLTEDSLTEQCLAVYRQDWPQNILENLSTCMKTVSSRWSSGSSGKFHLFLDFLAEFCGDMDYDPLVD